MKSHPSAGHQKPPADLHITGLWITFLFSVNLCGSRNPGTCVLQRAMLLTSHTKTTPATPGFAFCSLPEVPQHRFLPERIGKEAPLNSPLLLTTHFINYNRYWRFYYWLVYYSKSLLCRLKSLLRLVTVALSSCQPSQGYHPTRTALSSLLCSE